jgi:phosphate uptake regulator
MARDDEVNRLHFLLVRILRTIVQNPNLSEKLGVSPIECLDYRLVASLVEAIGDECVRLAMKVTELKSVKLAEDLKQELADLHTTCFNAHENALKAFLSGDMILAENVRRMREKTEKMFTDIEKIAKVQSLDVVPHVLAAASILRQIYEHSVDMADLAMPKKI